MLVVLFKNLETAYVLGGGGTSIVFTAAFASTDRTYVHFLGQAVVQNLTDVNGVELILDVVLMTIYC